MDLAEWSAVAGHLVLSLLVRFLGADSGFSDLNFSQTLDRGKILLPDLGSVTMIPPEEKSSCRRVSKYRNSGLTMTLMSNEWFQLARLRFQWSTIACVRQENQGDEKSSSLNT